MSPTELHDAMGGWSDAFVIIGTLVSALLFVDKKLRHGPLTDIRSDLDHITKLNCVHHSIMFDKLGITREEIAHAERLAGVKSKDT